MRLTIKGILTTQLFLLGLLLMNSCGDNIKTGEMTLTPDDNSTQIVLKTKGQSVSGLNLLIKGEIQGSGQLGFGGNDSTFYKTYNLTEGKIEIKYHGDWYSEFCYVTYKPTTETKGKLMIEGDFIGD